MSNKLPADPDTAGLRTPRRSTALRAAKVSVLRPADVECPGEGCVGVEETDRHTDDGEGQAFYR